MFCPPSYVKMAPNLPCHSSQGQGFDNKTNAIAKLAVFMNYFPTRQQPGCPKSRRFGGRTEVGSEGEFHEIIESASEVLLAGVARRREIHLEQQCASEGTVVGVRL